MKTIKYILLSVILIGFTACNDEEDFVDEPIQEELPELTSGSADFSNYVSLGNSLTAGFTDAALFIASQENSFPNILSSKFAMLGGGNFSQPLMSDNFGGMAVGGNRILEPRLVFGGAGPVPLESLIGPIMPTTDLLVNNPAGPFNNMGVPGAKSFHLLFDGYGNLGNLGVSANPYFIRMASSPTATVLGDAMAQSPTFFSLWIGNNDVLGYSLSGGDGSNPITDQPTFDFAINTLVTTLTSGGAKGIMANIPYVTTIPHFTTVPHNPVPLDATTAGALNQAYAAYNGGLLQIEGFGLITAEERAARTIVFEASATNAVVILDESLTDLTGINPALVNMRQATADDLIVLPASNFIGTLAVPGNPATVNGIAIPLADKWVLVPSEQEEINMATDNFNATIQAAANQAGLAFVDANMFMQELAAGGITFSDFTSTSNLVTGGAFSLDGVHPTARGYALLAVLFMDAIDNTYGSNFGASGNFVDIGDFPTNYSPLLQ
jgi:hypothetical protein